MLRRTFGTLLAVLLTVFATLPALAQPQSKTLADGITFIQDIRTDPSDPLVINVIKIDPKKPGVRVAAALGGDKVIASDATKGRETISRLVGRKGALAGVNADFFPWTGDPLGLSIMGGELVSEPMGRAAVGITASGRVLMDRVAFEGSCKATGGLSYPLKGINRPRGKVEMVLYTLVYGRETGASDGTELVLSLAGPVGANTDITATVQSGPSPAAHTVIPAGGAILSAAGGAENWIKANVKTGDKLTLRLDIRPSTSAGWDGVVEAVGGGPMLVRDSEVSIDAADEAFKPDFSSTRHPRTAVGVTGVGDILMVTVDGRQEISAGMSLSQLASLMKSLGSVQAMNLDGGGSTTLAIRGIVVNSPSGGGERPVANALVVYGPSEAAKPLPDMKLAWRDSHQLQLTDAATGQPVSGDVLGSVIWGESGGIGFVNQKGYFTQLRDGAGKVIALVGDKRLEIPVVSAPTEPPSQTAKLVGQLVIDPSKPNGGLLNVTLTDASGKGAANAPVTVTITGGEVDAPTKNTDSAGKVTFVVTPQPDLDSVKVTISAAGLTTVVK